MWSKLTRLVRRLLERVGVCEKDPRAVLARAREEFDRQMADTRSSLGHLSKTVAGLRARIDSQRGRLVDLERRLRVYEKVGQARLADQLRDEIRSITANLTLDARDLEATDRLHTIQLRGAQRIRREFDERVERVERLIDEVEISEAQAEATELIERAAREQEETRALLRSLEGVLEARQVQAAGRARAKTDLLL